MSASGFGRAGGSLRMPFASYLWENFSQESDLSILLKPVDVFLNPLEEGKFTFCG
jgi:hypothetical protein